MKIRFVLLALIFATTGAFAQDPKPIPSAQPIAVINIQAAVYQTRDGYAAQLAFLKNHATAELAAVNSLDDARAKRRTEMETAAAAHPYSRQHAAAGDAVKDADDAYANATAALREKYAAELSAATSAIAWGIRDTARQYIAGRYAYFIEVHSRRAYDAEEDITSAVAAAYDMQHPPVATTAPAAAAPTPAAH